MRDLNLLNYNGLIVIRPNVGFFTLICPNCNARFSSIQPLPEEIIAEVNEVANEIDAGMCRN